MDALEGFPRVVLGTWPTPVRRLENVSARLGAEVWVKSEANCGTWGGNKVRKLEYALPKLEGRSVSTHGAGTSSWASAVAFHAAHFAREVHLGLAGPIPEELALLYDRLDTRLHTSSMLNALPIVALRARLAAGRGGVGLPTGGSGLPGDVGSARAGLEIAEAVHADEIPAPMEVIVPCGTAGTAAGLAVGLGLGGLSAAVVPVRVTPRPWGTGRLVKRRARRLVAALQARTGMTDVSEPTAIVGEDRFFGGGYGKPTKESEEAIEVARHDGIELDPVYAAKAFAALIQRANSRGGPVLFVHTSPGPAPTSVPGA